MDLINLHNFILQVLKADRKFEDCKFYLLFADNGKPINVKKNCIAELKDHNLKEKRYENSFNKN